jgi:hypothetical protein
MSTSPSHDSRDASAAATQPQTAVANQPQRKTKSAGKRSAFPRDQREYIASYSPAWHAFLAGHPDRRAVRLWKQAKADEIVKSELFRDSANILEDPELAREVRYNPPGDAA